MENYPAIHKTQRLTIRPLTMADCDIWNTFLGDQDSVRYFSPGFEKKINPAPEWIERQLSRYAARELGLMALEETETRTFIGQAGILRQIVDEKEEIEVGYHLLKDHRGNGYASEAAIFLRDMAFKTLDIDSVISIIHVDNVASQHVAKRNGMLPGDMTKYMNLDVIIYRITRQTWNSL